MCCIMFIDLCVLTTHLLDRGVYDLFDVLLNFCKYFIENFCICVYQGNWSVNFFFIVSFSALGIRVMLASQNQFSLLSSLCISWSTLRSIDVTSSLKVYYDSTVNPSDLERLFIIASISLSGFYPLGPILVGIHLETYPFSLDFSSSLKYVFEVFHNDGLNFICLHFDIPSHL
jgi:hypothetical protein